MRYLLSIILCLWAGCAWAFPPGFMGAVTQGSVASGSTYYIGYKAETEQSSFTSPEATWLSFTSTSLDRIYLRKLTIPAGSTVSRIGVRFGAKVASGGVTAGVWTSSGERLAGAVLASASITPSANSWVFSSSLSGTQTVFASNTTVFVGYTYDDPTSFSVLYDSTPSSSDDYSYKTDGTYPYTSGGSLSYFTDRDLPVVLEYQR